MRLTFAERQAIVEEIRNSRPDAEIFLYGSRVDDSLKGGDIDVLAIAACAELRDRIDIVLAIKSRIGDQRIDLKLVTPQQAADDEFVQSVLPGAARLDI